MDLSPVVICAQGEAIWPRFIAQTLCNEQRRTFPLCPLLDLAGGGRSSKLFLTVGLLLTSPERKIIGYEEHCRSAFAARSTEPVVSRWGTGKGVSWVLISPRRSGLLHGW